MEFTANRMELLEMSKKVMKLANDSSPIEALKGIYVESDEDTGKVSMLTTNYEAAILMKEKASVARSGKIVFNAKMLTAVLASLSGENVELSADRGTLTIKADKTVFNLSCLSAANYPKPVMPFPDEAVKLKGICSLAKKTVFAVSKEESKGVLQCVSLKVKTPGYGSYMIRYKAGAGELSAFSDPPSEEEINRILAVLNDDGVDSENSYLCLWDDKEKKLKVLYGTPEKYDDGYDCDGEIAPEAECSLNACGCAGISAKTDYSEVPF